MAAATGRRDARPAEAGVRLDTVATMGPTAPSDAKPCREFSREPERCSSGGVRSSSTPLDWSIDVLAAAGRPGRLPGCSRIEVSWDVLLARGWGDEGAALARVVTAGRCRDRGRREWSGPAPGWRPSGEGLSDDGDPRLDGQRGDGGWSPAPTGDGPRHHVCVRDRPRFPHGADGPGGRGAGGQGCAAWRPHPRPGRCEALWRRPSRVGGAAAGWTSTTVRPSRRCPRSPSPPATSPSREYGQRLAYTSARLRLET